MERQDHSPIEEPTPQEHNDQTEPCEDSFQTIEGALGWDLIPEAVLDHSIPNDIEEQTVPDEATKREIGELRAKQEDALIRTETDFVFPPYLEPYFQDTPDVYTLSNLLRLIAIDDEQERRAVASGEKTLREVRAKFVRGKGPPGSFKTTAMEGPIEQFIQSMQQELNQKYPNVPPAVHIPLISWDKIEAMLNLGHGENVLTSDQLRQVKTRIANLAHELAAGKFPFGIFSFDQGAPAALKTYGQWDRIVTRDYNDDDPTPGVKNVRIEFTPDPWSRVFACCRQALMDLPTTATLEDFNDINDRFHTPRFSSLEEAKLATQGASLASIRTINIAYNSVLEHAAGEILETENIPTYIKMIFKPDWYHRLEEYRSDIRHHLLTESFPELNADAFIQQYIYEMQQAAHLLSVAPSLFLQQGMRALAQPYIVAHNTGIRPLSKYQKLSDESDQTKHAGVAFAYARSGISLSAHEMFDLREFIKPFGQALFLSPQAIASSHFR